MNSIVSLACLLVILAVINAEPINQRFDLWYRYQDRFFNFHRSHAYTIARSQKRVWRLPNTFRLNRREGELNDTSVTAESLVPTCYYTRSELVCTSTNVQSNDTLVCPVTSRFSDSLLEQLSIFALSEKRVVQTDNGQNVTKFYLYARYEPETVTGVLLAKQYSVEQSNRPVVSLHSIDSIQDDGLTVIDPVCWGKLVNYLSVAPVDQITLSGSNETRNISGALIFL